MSEQPTTPTRVLYSTKEDLLLGDIPLPMYISAEKVIADADDEIDSNIGFLYKTPLDLTDNEMNPIVRPARLLIKRISSRLASGRLILAVAAPAEQNQLHAYGRSLVREAEQALRGIADGSIILEGAPKLDDSVEPNGPLIANVDERSNVEAFYDRFSVPSPLSGLRGRIFP